MKEWQHGVDMAWMKIWVVGLCRAGRSGHDAGACGAGFPVTLLEQRRMPPRISAPHHPSADIETWSRGSGGALRELSGGLSAPLFHFRDRASGELFAEIDIGLLEGERPYPFVVQWEQYKLVHAALLHIEASGLAEVRFSTRVTGLEQRADDVEVTIIQRGGRGGEASLQV